MRVIEQLEHRYRSIENAWIPMTDGVSLAARLWIPQLAESRPVPAILEYIPYRKRDGTRTRDESMHGYFAGHGYAGVRVDLRGSGDSEGVLVDEYTERELADGLETLEWIAGQPWCNGRVGIIGISWGGFNGLQIAALQPPQLGAVISVCSTDDRYADDVHYMGGCLLGDNLSWASVMFSHNAAPPDPHVAGNRWRQMWLSRLENSDLWVENWMRHPHRDDYWRHGSVAEDYAAIRVPVLLASGWADGYANPIFRLLEHLDVPRRGLVGPWAHRYPHHGSPGPAIDFLHECVRWWDRWLSDIDNGADLDPMLRVFRQDSVPAHPYYETRPGRWIAETSWPSPNVQWRPWTLGPRTLFREGEAEVPHRALGISSPLSCGLFAGKWCSYSAAPDLPHDQREEDGGALTFDTEPLDGPIEILGAPAVELELSADQPVAQVVVRLSDVRPDGEATRVTYGVLNLTHRQSHASPTPLVPGHTYSVRVRLNDIAQRFPAGHRLRVAISTSYWPLIWPAPRPVMLTVWTRTSRLLLPERRPQPQDFELRDLGTPAQAPATAPEIVSAGEHRWLVVRDLASDVSTLEVIKDDGAIRHPGIDLHVERSVREWYSYRRNDMDSFRGEVRSERSYRRKDWSVRVVTHTILTADPDQFCIDAALDAHESERRVFSRVWNRIVPRDLL